MNTKLKDTIKNILDKPKNFLARLGKKAKILLIGGVAVVIVGIVLMFVVFGNHSGYTVLFTDLESDEASSIMNYLDTNSIPCRLEADTIYVKTDQEARIKADLLMEGYPKKGYAYESYFNNSSLMSTNSERVTAFLIALQERMESVIENFDGVQNAKVTIAQGEDRRYVLDSSNVVEASASVFVTMRDDKGLTKQHASAIRQLLAHSVENLKFENVSITDNNGNTYSSLDSSDATAESATLKLQIEEQVNSLIRSNIMRVLGGAFGSENIQVAVMSVVDVDSQVTDSTEYTIGEDGLNGRGIIGSRIWLNEILRGTDGEAAGGTVGTQTNSEPNFNDYVEGSFAVNGDEQSVTSQGEEHYDNNTYIQHTEKVGGVITDVSIAVTINGQNTITDMNTLRTHVARAAGLSPEQEDGRISIWVTGVDAKTPGSSDTRSPSPFLELPGFSWIIIAAVAVVLLLVLLILLISRLRRRGKVKHPDFDDEEELRRLQDLMYGPSGVDSQDDTQAEGADIMDINAEESMKLRKNIRQFVNNNPDIAAQIIKSWLKGDERNG